MIPRSVRLSEAPSFGLPIALYRADSRGAIAYAALAAELLRRDGAAATGSPDDDAAATDRSRAGATSAVDRREPRLDGVGARSMTIQPERHSRPGPRPRPR